MTVALNSFNKVQFGYVFYNLINKGIQFAYLLVRLVSCTILSHETSFSFSRLKRMKIYM
jgi:hypothetical protein